ncbi:Flp pilus assembly protein CpaB [Agromyces sp. NPDC057865]|uniref:Flp pilus assembly protein CpaB n=1 Tax=Agromyces sp. NPDC057865 TaxID=3346267 RepID=UPI0036721EBB
MIRIIGAIVAVLLAVAGGFALYLYVQSADARAAEGAEFQKVYIVTDEVPQGTPGESINEFIEVDELPAISIQSDIVTDLTTLEGLVANATLYPGEQLIEARFSNPEELAAEGEVTVPAGMQEITVALPVERVVGGAVVPGSKVGVVISSNTASQSVNDQTAQTQFTYHGMLVTRVTPGRTLVSGDSEESTEVSAFLVTLAATTPQVEKIAYAAEQQDDNNGGIWLTLEPDTADQSGSTQRNGENIFQ